MKQQPNRQKRLQFYVEEKEYETLIAVFEASGYSSLSAFLRKKNCRKWGDHSLSERAVEHARQPGIGASANRE
jgi:hypothetical protein